MHILLLAFQKFSFINPSMRISTAKIYYYLRLIRRAPKVQQKVQVGNAATRLRLLSSELFIQTRYARAVLSRSLLSLLLLLSLNLSLPCRAKKLLKLHKEK